MERIRLLLVDDHRLFREGLARLLNAEAEFEVVAHCADADEALNALRESAVDLILLDFALAGEPGDALLERLRGIGYTGKVLMVTARMNAEDSLRVLRLGASGIFLKYGSPRKLIEAIRLVASGEVWMDPQILQLVVESAAPAMERRPQRPLTAREEHVLHGVLEGQTNRRIAGVLGVSEGAVKAVLQQLFEKAGVHTRSQLVRAALEGRIERRAG